MNTIISLLAAAGVTFGLQNKVPFLHGKNKILDSLLGCTYCTGFHAGWLVYVISAGIKGIVLKELIIFAFASAIFSYGLDELIKYLEGIEEEE